MYRIFSVASAVVILAGCDMYSDDVYTLYRSSMTGPNMRIHVASFDSKDGDQYNRENCEITQDLFIKQPGVAVRYWCEKGRFKK